MARLPDRDPKGIQIQRLNTPHGLPSEGYANQAKRDVWRFTNKAGDGATVDAQIGDFREAA
jgi:hypothetical protein